MADAAYLLGLLPGWATFLLALLLLVVLALLAALECVFSAVAFGASFISGTDF